MRENVHPLQKWRESVGMSTPELGRKIECTRQSVRRYEAGRMPDQPYLDRIVILSDGEVDANAWLGKEAADVVSKRQASV